MRPVMATSSVLSDTLRSMPTGWLSRSLTRRYSVTASRTRSRHAADCSGSRKPTSIHDERTSSATPAGVRWAAGEVPEVAQRVVGRDADRGVRALRAGLRPRTVEVLHAVAARAVEPGEQPRRRAGVERRGHAREGRLLGGSRRHADTLRTRRHATPAPSRAMDNATPTQWARRGDAVEAGCSVRNSASSSSTTSATGAPSGCSGALAPPPTAATSAWPPGLGRRHSCAPRRARGRRGRGRAPAGSGAATTRRRR